MKEHASCLLFQVLTGVLLYETLAWQVKMPKEIHGLKGSCLVIPCSFSYTSDPPKNPYRVVWYQWVSRGYPLVYDSWNPSKIIDKFKGKTELFGRPSDGNCSLVIKSLDQSHNEEKLYTWIDPENVGSGTFAFYDFTSTIHVDTLPQQPTISVSGGEIIGNSITVQCYTVYTCPYRKPNIVLKGVDGSDQIQDVGNENGQWKRTLTRRGVVKTERSDLDCTVTHDGGIISRHTKSHFAQCVHYNISIEPKRADFIEGVAKNFVCTIYHSCLKDLPTILWNYKNMKVLGETKRSNEFVLASISNITFLGTKEDHGRKLTCTAKISKKDMTSSVDLHVQDPQTPVIPPQNTTHEKTSDLMTVGLYILVPLFLLLVVCTIVGVFMYKRCQRSSPVVIQQSQLKQMTNDAYEKSDIKVFSKPRMPSPKSKKKGCSMLHDDDLYANMGDDGDNMYGNI